MFLEDNHVVILMHKEKKISLINYEKEPMKCLRRFLKTRELVQKRLNKLLQ